MSASPMNVDLLQREIAYTGKRYCRSCNSERPVDGGHKPHGRAPWRCAHCHQQAQLGPMQRRKRA
jgi:transposase-like protein